MTCSLALLTQSGQVALRQQSPILIRSERLFLQGTRDALADVHLMEKLAHQLGPRATLKLLSDADHSFHVPARTGRKDADVRAEALDR